MVHRLILATLAAAFAAGAALAPQVATGQHRSMETLAADAARIVEILEAERARLSADYERLAMQVAELEAALAKRPTGELPASASQLAELERLRARLAELEAVEADDPREQAQRQVLEAFLTVRSRLEPVAYPQPSFESTLSVRRTSRAAELRTGPDEAYPSRSRVEADVPVVVLAEEKGGSWRLIIAGDAAGYILLSDLKEF